MSGQVLPTTRVAASGAGTGGKNKLNWIFGILSQGRTWFHGTRWAQGLVGALLVGVLASCGLVEGDGRANQPLSQLSVSKLKSMGSSPAAAMIVRLFKEENTLEVWKQVGDGTFKLFKSYEICAWSGELGPKFKEGDRQSPEGFYTITPGLMNPRSSYYLAFNTGFPNKFDRAWGRTGSDLMVHGDCSSRGCYAMTDEQIAEIYALGRESFKGGQRTFSLQLYPFHMTVENMVKHRNNPNIDFWWNIKQGYDAFEISRKEVSWDVCERRYVFYPPGGGLNANGTCPAGSANPGLMAEVAKRQSVDLAAFKIAAAEADKTDAKKVAQAEKAAVERQRTEEVLAARTKAVSEVVEGSTEGISSAVGGFFQSLFGGSSQPATSRGQPIYVPYPAPRLNRG